SHSISSSTAAGTPPCHGRSRARSVHRRSDIIAVPAYLDQAGPSCRASVFASTSSPFPLKNLEGWCYECGDRPPSSPPPVTVAVAESTPSVLGAD
ncbi:Os10g0470100, partial [Oryza sativa Japonica Group]